VTTPAGGPSVVRGAAALRLLHAAFVALDGLVHRILPERYNPFARTGAIAVVSFLIAVVSGIVILIWYTPSAAGAWSSLRAMEQARWSVGILRSIHRYSSDACVLFYVLHALRVVAAGRFTGARWLAWLSGLFLAGLVWFVGWTGYWLVWDQRGQLVARGTAVFVDTLPIFEDPLSRSFLVDETLNSLLFFVVFFLHMVLPLILGMALWIHVYRLSRPQFLTGKSLSIAIVAATVAVSAAVPALSAPPARMATEPASMTVDLWYLAPLWLTERLGAAALWALCLGALAVLGVAPWLGARRRAAAAVVADARCNSCEKCFVDCPYDAIRMVPRSDGRPFPYAARVTPERCVGCGICAGSCDSAGVGVPWLRAEVLRHTLDGWLDAEPRDAPRSVVVFACERAPTRALAVDGATGRAAALPGARVALLPCAGWLHPLTVERAFRHGAAGVVVATCADGDCVYREGATWTHERLAGARAPPLRVEHVDPARLQTVRLEGGALGPLVHATRELVRLGPPGTEGRQIAPPGAPGHPSSTPRAVRSPLATAVAGVILTAVLGAVTLVGADVPYRAPAGPRSELVVSFLHPGVAGQNCRTLSPEELASRPVHMRRAVECDRGRAPVRLRVWVDGRRVHARAYAAGGVFGDNASVALARIPVPPGQHDVRIAIGDTADRAEWSHRAEKTVRFARHERRVVTFDRTRGFEWY
jgi:coenzyme F420-reducing hydrogenase delta subunit/ferredoxin